MNKPVINRTMLALSLGLALSTPLTAADTAAVHEASVFSQSAGKPSVYILGLKRPPLALADTVAGSGLTRLPMSPEGRLDVHAPQSINYVASLRAEQDNVLARLSNTLGRQLRPTRPEFQFQHAFNGVVVELSDAELLRVAEDPDVSLIEPYTEYPLDTDVGPALIGAPSLWTGSATVGGLASKGEGTVIGVIDSGINIGSPAFADIGDDGYNHTNPLGSGTYLGLCVATPANCNDKLIGGYDFVDSQATASQREAPGFEDENGHGSHTTSTAGGNQRNGALFNGVALNVSGVAPHANIIAYDACYTVISSGQGTCPNVSTLASINQAVADGIVDAINYSIGGGTNPWVEANSQAFLAAHNAGIFVAASAGNSGPGPNTLGHVEPWVTTSAASTHSRAFGSQISMTGPASPPSNTQNVTIRMGASPWPATTTTGPLIRSPGFANGANDGCAAFPANTFRAGGIAGGAQGIAVLKLDSATSACGSGARRTNALNAGAIGVIFVDTFFLNLGASGTSWTMQTSDWNLLEAHYNTDPANAAVSITAAQGVLAQADTIAAFSSRGPNGFDLLKPDVTGPGVNILASFPRWVAASPAPFGGAVDTARNPLLGLNSGTSMSSPHTAGSGALLRALNRSWTPSQIKSALVSTATQAVFKEDGVTNSDPFDRGGGRVDLTKAAKAGLLMDETGANFTAANPANGGSPGQLNLPSFQELSCVGTCTFARTVRSTRTAPTTWTASFEGIAAASLSPSSFSLANSASANITLSVDSLQLPANTTVFGNLVLTPNNVNVPVQRFPIAVRAALPDIDVTPASLTASAAVGATATADLTVANAGNPSINWSYEGTGSAVRPIFAQSNNAANGFNSGTYSGATTGGVYPAEDIIFDQQHTLRSLRVEGFMLGAPANPLATAATSITYKIYSSFNNAGTEEPAGNPDAGPAGEVWSCVRTTTAPNNAGLSFQTADGATFTLDLAAATGCPAPPVLAADTRYWVVIYPQHTAANTGRRWLWFRATSTNGAPARIFSAGAWASLGSVPPALDALALTVQTEVPCGAPWMSAATTSGTLGLASSTQVPLTFDATSLTAGTYKANACISSNGTDADEPRPSVPVTLTVQAPAIFTDGFEDP